MQNRTFKKFVSTMVVAFLLLSSLGTAMAAPTSVSTDSDIKGHWAEAQITAWMAKGLIKGYEDGNFKPGNQITRAEFMALINRSFEFTEGAAVSFSDVQAGNWAYPEVAKAIKAGYITGYADGTIGAGKPISRQEVAVIVDRLLGLSSTDSTATAFSDSGSIAAWATQPVSAAVAKGILKGYAEDNSFKPGQSITRAEAVVTLDRAVMAKATAYNTAGTYGPATGMETINGDVTINVTGVTLQNIQINGKLLFAAGIGSGDAYLNNVIVKGDTTVNGGGINSLHFKNSQLFKVIILAGAPVRVVAEGSTTVGPVEVSSPATLEEDGTTGMGFGDITLKKELPAGSTTTLKGSFDNVIVLGDKINVVLPDGTHIIIFKTDTDPAVTGKGTVKTADLGKDSKATFETKPTETATGGAATPTAAPGSSPSEPTATPSPVVQKGSVAGFIHDSKDEPVVSVTVSVYSGSEGNGALVGSVESGANGAYSIGGVPAGSFYLKLAKDGYIGSTVTPVNHAVSVNATTDASTAYLYRNLVKGYVTDSSHHPIPSLEVNLVTHHNVYHTSVTTEADGSFSIYDAPEGENLYLDIHTALYGGYSSWFSRDWPWIIQQPCDWSFKCPLCV